MGTQYYFTVALNLVGLFISILGLRILIVQSWNIFADPVTMVIIVLSAIVCVVNRYAIVTFSNYMRIWEVVHQLSETTHQTSSELFHFHSSDHRTDEIALVPPPSSKLRHWSDAPPLNDETGQLEKYRRVFISENQVWLQNNFRNLISSADLQEYRLNLLRGVSAVLGEVNPQLLLHPSETDAHESGVATAMIQLSDSKISCGPGSAPHAMAMLWLNRARFLLLLNQVSS